MEFIPDPWEPEFLVPIDWPKANEVLREVMQWVGIKPSDTDVSYNYATYGKMLEERGLAIFEGLE
jgi:hypothetical protein